MGVKLEFCQLHMATKDPTLIIPQLLGSLFLCTSPSSSLLLPPPAIIITAKPNLSKNVVHPFLPLTPHLVIGNYREKQSPK